MRHPFHLLLAVSILAGSLAACKGSGAPVGLATPEGAFEQIKKALLNRDADLMWDSMADKWKETFEKGRQELVAKPQEEKENIAKEGMVTAADIDKMDAKAFFRFYFNYRNKELYTTTAPEILEKRTDALKDSTITNLTYIGPDKKNAMLVFDMGGKSFNIELIKVGDQWLMDQREGAKSPMP